MTRFLVIRTLFLVLILATTGVPASATAQDADPTAVAGVPTLAGDPGRTGVNPGPGPAGVPSERWRFDSTHVGTSQALNAPAVVDGTLYVTGKSPIVYALDVATGVENWRFEAAGGYLFQATPAVGGGLVYTAAGPTLYALDAATGVERWSYEAASPLSTSPALVDGTLFVVGHSPSVVLALDAATGAERWTVAPCPDPAGSCVAGGPVVADGLVFAVGGPHNGPILYAYDVASGEERWQMRVSTQFDGAVVAAGGAVYVQNDIDLVAVDAASGQERWRTAIEWFNVRFAVAGETVFVAASFLGTEPHPAVFAFDAVTGAERWRTGLGPLPNANAYAGPTVVGDTLYVAGTHGDTPYGLSALDTATGAERWHLPLEHGFPVANPVVVDGLIFLGAGPREGASGGLLALA